MLCSAWLRGIFGGTLAAVLILALPGSWFADPAGATGLSITAMRLALVVAAFMIGYLIESKRFSRGDQPFDGADSRALSAAPAVPSAISDTDFDARLARIETALAALPDQTTKAIKAGPSADLDRTLRSIQRALRKPHNDALLVEAIHALQPDGVLIRMEALGMRLVEQMAAIDARLAMVNLHEPPQFSPLSHLPARRPNGVVARRIGRAVADIRRSIDGLPH